jgi:hypothetical protein
MDSPTAACAPMHVLRAAPGATRPRQQQLHVPQPLPKRADRCVVGGERPDDLKPDAAVAAWVRAGQWAVQFQGPVQAEGRLPLTRAGSCRRPRQPLSRPRQGLRVCVCVEGVPQNCPVLRACDDCKLAAHVWDVEEAQGACGGRHRRGGTASVPPEGARAAGRGGAGRGAAGRAAGAECASLERVRCATCRFAPL